MKKLFRNKLDRIATAILALIIVLFVAFRIIVRNGFDSLEEDLVRTNAESGKAALAKELTGLQLLSQDYAFWDDTKQFMNGQYDEYPEEVTYTSESLENLGVNQMNTGLDGEAVYEAHRDLKLPLAERLLLEYEDKDGLLSKMFRFTDATAGFLVSWFNRKVFILSPVYQYWIAQERGLSAVPC
ncbi:MAG: hypothetical protein MZV64_09170 [Ignavibacteriales bacterium]|nr:hypothetical protein [Ignavibacteriales bacterium]